MWVAGFAEVYSGTIEGNSTSIATDKITKQLTLPMEYRLQTSPQLKPITVARKTAPILRHNFKSSRLTITIKKYNHV